MTSVHLFSLVPIDYACSLELGISATSVNDDDDVVECLSTTIKPIFLDSRFVATFPPIFYANLFWRIFWNYKTFFRSDVSIWQIFFRRIFEWNLPVPLSILRDFQNKLLTNNDTSNWRVKERTSSHELNELLRPRILKRMNKYVCIFNTLCIIQWTNLNSSDSPDSSVVDDSSSLTFRLNCGLRDLRDSPQNFFGTILGLVALNFQPICESQ